MKSLIADSAALSSRCSHRTAAGRQCRLPVSGSTSGLCPQHRPQQPQKDAKDCFVYLSRDYDGFQTAQGINHSLNNLFELLSRNAISPRRAAVLAYISSLLLRTLPQIDADTAAGITSHPKNKIVSTASSPVPSPLIADAPLKLIDLHAAANPCPEPDPAKKPS